jgi:hypothetical protein
MFTAKAKASSLLPLTTKNITYFICISRIQQQTYNADLNDDEKAVTNQHEVPLGRTPWLLYKLLGRTSTTSLAHMTICHVT